MFGDFSHLIYLRSQRPPGYGARGLWWLVMAPGLGLIGASLAMIIWPELLAYVVASLLLCAGLGLTGAGWRLWRLEQHRRQDGSLYRRPNEPDDWTR